MSSSDSFYIKNINRLKLKWLKNVIEANTTQMRAGMAAWTSYSIGFKT